ncbi:MAG: flavodoxin [Halochromatium sp.]|uniref:flavodoxin n=1 Tax=Halochromatium sp. TaxID=2049430 RepID=UPI00397D0EBD
MHKIGLFYASMTGATQEIAECIQASHFEPGCVDLFAFEDAEPEDLAAYDALIIGTSTWGDGEYPDSLEAFLPQLDAINFEGKRIALFGLGDQLGYPLEFVDALGLLYQELKERGAILIGDWPSDGYEYEASKADLGDGRFCGLVLDQDNQPELTPQRLAAWIDAIRGVLLQP